ncbi:MAG: Mg/Co/Ni transporter MgtE / domain protein [Myxococcaceae bacterium]|nr:Mg/Co/Ni transporter MgtE / domain protein [Myxococcaceae bacterium]
MRLAKLLGPDLAQTLAQDPDELREALDEFHSEDIAELLEDLPQDEAIALFRAVPADLAAAVLAHMPEEERARILERLGAENAAEVIAQMAPDDRADAIQDLPSPIAEMILSHIAETEPEMAEDLRDLASYPEDSAGGLMTTEYVALSPNTKVWQAIEAVRQYGRQDKAETLYYAYVVAFGGKLVGVVSLKELILNDPGVAVEDVMTENVIYVHPSVHQEEVARTFQKYSFSALPVVDEHGRMLGLVTVDDVMDVVIEEATEDAQMMGAVQPMDDAYFATDFWTFIKKRAPWLIVLFAGELLTASVMHGYEHELGVLVDLVVFIPLIISSGGNSGSQSSSLIIRALAVGEIQPSDWYRIFVRELAIGAVLGVTLGVVGFLRAFLLQEHEALRIATAVSVSVLAVVMVGTLVGSLLPLAIKRVGLDPAVSSTPFIASLVDVLGLLVYFSVARLIFAQLL